MTKNNEKTIAAVSYITPIGWIVALVLYLDKKTALAGFHIRQSLLLMIAWLAFAWIPVVRIITGIILFVLWLMGLIYAINGEKKEVPILGKYAQEWFKGL